MKGTKLNRKSLVLILSNRDMNLLWNEINTYAFKIIIFKLFLLVLMDGRERDAMQ